MNTMISNILKHQPKITRSLKSFNVQLNSQTPLTSLFALKSNNNNNISFQQQQNRINLKNINVYTCSFSTKNNNNKDTSNKSKFNLTIKRISDGKREYNRYRNQHEQEQEQTNKEYFESAKTSNSLIFGLIAINVGVFLFINNDDSYQFQKMILDNFTLSTDTFPKQPHTLITSFFAHKDFYHLLFNMLGLYTIGSSLLYSIGTGPFLTVYFGAGIAGGLGYLFLQKYYDQNNRSIYRRRAVGALGASGAIYGIFSTYALLYPTSTFLIYGIVPVPALALLGGYVAWDFYNEYYHKNTGIAHSGHLCGGLFGALYYLTKLRRRY